MPPDLDGWPAVGLIANPAPPLPARGEPQWAEAQAQRRDGEDQRNPRSSVGMNLRVVTVRPETDFTLTFTFSNGEVRVFDVKPYLNIGIFRELQDRPLFNSVWPVLGSIQWQNGQDFCPDTLYLDGIPAPEPWQVAA